MVVVWLWCGYSGQQGPCPCAWEMLNFAGLKSQHLQIAGEIW